jgi:hypothetical protein
MVNSSDNQFFEDHVTIDDQYKSPIEQVWEDVLTSIEAIESPIEQVWEDVLLTSSIDEIDEKLGTSGSSHEVNTENADAKEQDKTADTLTEMTESGAEIAQDKIQEATHPEGYDAVDNSEISNVNDQSSEATADTLKELSEMLETAKDTLRDMEDKIHEATKGE